MRLVDKCMVLKTKLGREPKTGGVIGSLIWLDEAQRGCEFL
jgi:hypothetical protein